MVDRVDPYDAGDPDDLAEARRIIESLQLDESQLAQVLAEIQGGARRRARDRYIAEGAANDGLDWFPGIWGRRQPK